MWGRQSRIPLGEISNPSQKLTVSLLRPYTISDNVYWPKIKLFCIIPLFKVYKYFKVWIPHPGVSVDSWVRSLPVTKYRAEEEQAL